jgi:hypothetical protein
MHDVGMADEPANIRGENLSSSLKSISRGAQSSAPLRENTTTFSTHSNLSRASSTMALRATVSKWDG